ncbi:hypothetical protein NL676_039536 [Syzygium grande]|nr:hypothetical protein NL676_039536 [Syzygium grande]
MGFGSSLALVTERKEKRKEKKDTVARSSDKRRFFKERESERNLGKPKTAMFRRDNRRVVYAQNRAEGACAHEE